MGHKHTRKQHSGHPASMAGGLQLSRCSVKINEQGYNAKCQVKGKLTTVIRSGDLESSSPNLMKWASLTRFAYLQVATASSWALGWPCHEHKTYTRTWSQPLYNPATLSQWPAPSSITELKPKTQYSQMPTLCFALPTQMNIYHNLLKESTSPHLGTKPIWHPKPVSLTSTCQGAKAHFSGALNATNPFYKAHQAQKHLWWEAVCKQRVVALSCSSFSWSMAHRTVITIATILLANSMGMTSLDIEVGLQSTSLMRSSHCQAKDTSFYKCPWSGSSCALYMPHPTL